MKTFIILILTLALVAAAYFTRPSEESLRVLVREHIETQADGPVERTLAAAAADTHADRINYVDHYLWVTAERDGRTLYIGAFSHWFTVGQNHRWIPSAETADADGSWYAAIGVGN